MQPMQAGAFHPLRTHSDSPRKEIKCGPDTEHEMGIEVWEQSAHEQILTWRADSNPDYVGPEQIDPCNQIALLGRGQLSERRRVCTGDSSQWILSAESRCELIGNTWLAAIEEVGIAREFRAA